MSERPVMLVGGVDGPRLAPTVDVWADGLALPAEIGYVTETPTGLAFRDDTPLEVVGEVIARLCRQHKRIEWAIGDAINFAERRYGDTYTAWVEQTGLSEHTLATIRWVAERIESSRRREDVGWSHHREVASLPADIQDRVLSEASERGMTRWDVRQAVKVETEKLRGRAVTADGEDIETAELPWVPDLADLTDEARNAVTARAPLGRRRNDWIAGALWMAQWRGDESVFIEGRFQP